VPGRGKPGPRAQREQHGQTELAQLIQDGLEPLRIVGVLRAVARTYSPGPAPRWAAIVRAATSSGAISFVASTTVWSGPWRRSSVIRCWPLPLASGHWASTSPRPPPRGCIAG
jgi:hypothetical protein